MDYNRILVPVIGTPVDGEAISLACDLARKNKGKIWAVYVITLERTLPLDAEIEPEIVKAEEILEGAIVCAEEHDYEIETDLLQAREAGPTIIDAAIQHDADVILMGIEYKQRFGQFSLGDVAPYVLKNAPCRVILYQYFNS